MYYAENGTRSLDIFPIRATRCITCNTATRYFLNRDFLPICWSDLQNNKKYYDNFLFAIDWYNFYYVLMSSKKSVYAHHVDHPNASNLGKGRNRVSIVLLFLFILFLTFLYKPRRFLSLLPSFLFWLCWLHSIFLYHYIFLYGWLHNVSTHIHSLCIDHLCLSF